MTVANLYRCIRPVEYGATISDVVAFHGNHIFYAEQLMGHHEIDKPNGTEPDIDHIREAESAFQHTDSVEDDLPLNALAGPEAVVHGVERGHHSSLTRSS